MLSTILLYGKYSSPLEAFVVGALSFLVGSFILFIIGKIFGLFTKSAEKQAEKNYEEDKAKSFINSDNQGNGGYYKYLLEELLEKCNPKNFMNPYDYEKVSISNNLFSQLQVLDKSENDKLLQISDEAVNKLGIKISTSSIYDELCKMCDPQQFLSPYDPVKLAKANELYSRIMQNRQNISALAEIREEAKTLLGIVQKSKDETPQGPSTGWIVFISIVILMFLLWGFFAGLNS